MNVINIKSMSMFSILIIIMTSFLIILQWNAQGMWGHGEELTKWLFSRKGNPFDLICLQETWYDDHNIVPIPNYKIIPQNREGLRRMCFLHP